MTIGDAVITFLSSVTATALVAFICKPIFQGAIDAVFKDREFRRNLIGQSDLEFRKQQLEELYGPIYAYLKLNDTLYDLWLAKKLNGINMPLLKLFKEQNDEIMRLLATKTHLIDGPEIPPSFIRFSTCVTIWNLYTSTTPEHAQPPEVEALAETKFPDDFMVEIYSTTERLKREIDTLHKQYRGN